MTIYLNRNKVTSSPNSSCTKRTKFISTKKRRIKLINMRTKIRLSKIWISLWLLSWRITTITCKKWQRVLLGKKELPVFIARIPKTYQTKQNMNKWRMSNSTNYSQNNSRKTTSATKTTSLVKIWRDAKMLIKTRENSWNKSENGIKSVNFRKAWNGNKSRYLLKRI